MGSDCCRSLQQDLTISYRRFTIGEHHQFVAVQECKTGEAPADSQLISSTGKLRFLGSKELHAFTSRG